MGSARIWRGLAGGAIGMWAAVLCQAQPVIKTIGGGIGGVPMGVSATSIGLSQNFPGLKQSFTAGGPIAVDSSGNVYAAALYRIYRIDPSGKASVLAGTGVPGFSDGGGIALNAQIGFISGLAADTDGSLYASDLLNLCVWKVNPAAGSISRVAGLGIYLGIALLTDTDPEGLGIGDGGPATSAGLAGPSVLALDHQGNLYILTAVGIRKVALSTGLISSFPLIASTAEWALDGDVVSMAIDNTATNLFLADLTAGAVYQVSLCTGAVTATAIPAGFLAFDGQNNLYSMAVSTAEIYQVGAGGTGTATPLVSVKTIASSASKQTPPGGMAIDSSNNLYFTWEAVWKSNTSGAAPAVYGGDASADYNGDGPALLATFSESLGMAADRNGNVYVSDTLNNRVRMINLATETVSTVAGKSVPGNSGDGGQATSAELNFPTCLAVDSAAANLYITDANNKSVRQVVLATGVISTLVGAGNGPSGFQPACIALDGIGHLYILETSSASYRLDQVTLSNGQLVSMAAPSGISMGTGTGGIAADASGNIYVSYYNDRTVYRYTNGVPTLFAGTPDTYGDSGDYGPATSATLDGPQALALDGLGNLFINDQNNERIRRVQLSSGTIYPVTADFGSEPSVLIEALEALPINNLPIACAALPAATMTADGSGNLFFSVTLGDLILEGANWAAAPALTVAETVGVSPSTEGLGITTDSAPVSASTVETWNVGSNHTLAAPATETGQDGYTYSFVSWSDGNSSPSRPVTAGSCPATYTALYSEPSCQTLLSATATTMDQNNRNSYVYVVTPTGANCSWTAQSNASWISLINSSGTGTGAVMFSVARNETEADRSGTITVAGQPFTVTQLTGSDCFFTLRSDPSSSYLPASNASGSLYVEDIGSCSENWQVSSEASWLHVTSGGNTNDSGAVTYSADSNTTGAARTGTLMLSGPANNPSFTVTQEPAGVDLVLSSTSATLPGGGGTGSIAVNAIDAACDMWSAVSNAPWIAIDGPALGNSGAGIVAYSVPANAGAARQGSITIAGQTVTVNQAGGSCSFSLTSPSASAPPGGGTGSFGLTASDPTCFWSVASTESWLTLTSAAVGSGTTTVTYSAASTSTARSGTILIAGQTFTVNQTAGYAVTFQTGPAGLQVMVDGAAIGSSTVTLAGTHTISVASPQAGGAGTQYVFANWSDGGAQSHSVNVTAAASYTANFTTQYQLTIAAAPAAGGTVTPESGGYYNAGASVPIVATAASGYQFANWTGSVAASASASTSVTMSAPETVTANFTALTAITIQTNPAGLEFTVDGGTAQTAPQTVTLAPGPHTITVALTQAGAPGTQYVFGSWSDSGAASHIITVGSSAASYTATFQTQYQLTISASPAAGGTVTPASGGFYNAATSVSIAATANPGYQFSGWSGPAASSSSASTTVTMTAPETVTANFSSLTGITIQTNPPGLQFTVDGGAAQTAPQTLNLSAGSHTIAVAALQTGSPGTQYVFSSWSDGGAASHSITVGSSAATYTATFQTQYQLTISALPAAGGTVIPASGVYYNSGASVAVSATAASGYTFSGWTGSVASASSASTSVTMSGPETVTANFSSLSGITIQTSPSGLQFSVDGGAAQSAPQTLSLAQGTHTIAVAPTQAGTVGTQYTFLSWNDGGAASHSITVGSSPATYTATFTTQYQLTISASPAADGTISPASGSFYSAGSSVPVAATAASGFQFVNWTGPVANANSASTTIAMTGPFAITANFTAMTTTSGLAFYPVTPCRVADTRNAAGPFGGPILSAGSTRGFAIPSSACGIPSTAQAYSLNITVVPPAALGYLTAWPAGQAQPYVSTLNSSNGAIIANAAIVPAGTGGAISIYVSDATHVIIDINGYFAAPSGTTALAFYPVTPCRVADTRNPNGPFGGPSLTAGASRNFTVPQSACGIPATAQAYSLNMTVVPPGALEYLSAWPAGQTQPVVSTLNALQGQIAANAAIVPAGTNGAISVYVSDPSNVIIDINGYFGPPGGTGALYFYPVTPCRIADTRNAAGTFGGPLLGAGAARSFPIPSSSCGLPAAAQAYAFNMTVVPPGPLLYLSTWPAGQTQPVVSTLNDLQGQVVANAAIVPAGTAGAISVYVSDPTNLIIDVNGYFAP